MFIIAAFRTSVVCGLCVIFLGPAQFLFLIMHWEDAKRAFGITMLGVLIGFAAIFSGMGSAGTAKGGLAEVLEKSGVAEHQLEALQKLAEEDMESAVEDSEPSKPSRARKLSGRDPKRFVGSTLTEVCKELGRPKGEMKRREMPALRQVHGVLHGWRDGFACRSQRWSGNRPGQITAPKSLVHESRSQPGFNHPQDSRRR
jgi:hypothetical protein